jgi:hypothetical protein
MTEQGEGSRAHEADDRHVSDRELQVHGSAKLVRRLFDNHLSAGLELVESRSTPKAVTIQVYRPSGRPQYETATADPST